MGPQRSIAAVVAAGLAVIVSIIVVVWVAVQPRGGAAEASSGQLGAGPLDVGEPTVIADGQLVEVLRVTERVPAGSPLRAALDTGAITTVAVPAELVPPDAVRTADEVAARTASVHLLPATILTEANTGGPASTAAPPSVPADCPKDWAGTPEAGQKLVYVVTADVAKGTTVAQAVAAGALRPRLVAERHAPTEAVASVGSVCTHPARFHLTPGTLLMDGTFGPP